MGDFSNWITTTPSGKPEPNARKVIMRHVMRNKNTRASRETAKVKQLMLQYGTQWLQQQESRTAGAYGDEKEWTPLLPRQVANELACFDFGIDLKPYMVDLIYRAFTTIKPLTYTIERTLVGERQDNLLCFENMSHHPAMIHAVLFTAQTFYDASTGIPQGRAAQYHLAETLRHLQFALNTSNERSRNTTMAVVVSLAMASAIYNDLKGLLMHLDGLFQMVMLRGGLHSLGPGSMIEHKTQRLDFGLAIATGNPLRFFREVTSWGPAIALDCATQCPELNMLQPRPDERLMYIWADLREFSKVANQATRTGVKMSPGFFCQLTDTVPYRLMKLRFSMPSTSELLRLCMLAYTKSLLTQIRGLGNQMVYLHSNLKVALLAHASSTGPESALFLVWALFIAASFVFEDFDRGWIQEMMVHKAGGLEMKSWESARAALKGFLWTDLVCDKVGERLFDSWLG